MDQVLGDINIVDPDMADIAPRAVQKQEKKSKEEKEKSKKDKKDKKRRHSEVNGNEDVGEKKKKKSKG